jgi:predicted transcriptional regulator
MLGVRLDTETEIRLAALAHKTKRSKSYLAKEAIRLYIEQQEKIALRNADSLTRWEVYKATAESVSNEDMMKWLDSWGTDDELPCPIVD